MAAINQSAHGAERIAVKTPKLGLATKNPTPKIGYETLHAASNGLFFDLTKIENSVAAQTDTVNQANDDKSHVSLFTQASKPPTMNGNSTSKMQLKSMIAA